MPREPVLLECTICKSRNYVFNMDLKGGKKLEVKKYCRPCRSRQIHKARKA